MCISLDPHISENVEMLELTHMRLDLCKRTSHSILATERKYQMALPRCTFTAVLLLAFIKYRREIELQDYSIRFFRIPQSSERVLCNKSHLLATKHLNTTTLYNSNVWLTGEFSGRQELEDRRLLEIRAFAFAFSLKMPCR